MGRWRWFFSFIPRRRKPKDGGLFTKGKICWRRMKPGWASKCWIGAAALSIAAMAAPADHVAPGVTFVPGAVNGVLVERKDGTIAIYGDPRPRPARVRSVLFTHHRRDVVWAGRELVRNGAEAIAPEAEKDRFTGVRDFWEQYYTTKRFHDYANQSSRILSEPLP